MASINDILLDNNQTIWTDEYAWSPVGQSAETDIHGGLVVEYISPNQDGRPVTLSLGWISKARLDLLVALRDADPQEIMTLTLPDGRTLDVLWRHHDAVPIEAAPVNEYPAYLDNDYFEVTLNLMEVSS